MPQRAGKSRSQIQIISDIANLDILNADCQNLRRSGSGDRLFPALCGLKILLGELNLLFSCKNLIANGPKIHQLALEQHPTDQDSPEGSRYKICHFFVLNVVYTEDHRSYSYFSCIATIRRHFFSKKFFFIFRE